MENPGVPNFEEELRKASQAAKEVEVPEKVSTKFSNSKAAKTAKKVSADVTAQSKKIVAEAVKVSKKSAPVIAELWKKTVSSISKLFANKSWSFSSLVEGPKALWKKLKVSGKNTKLVYVVAGSAVVLALVVTALVRLEVVTVTKGIPLVSGKSTGTSVMIDKFSEVKRGDLIIGVLPGTKKDEKKTILGSIFSQNDQTYAIYDGEVIWQLPLRDLVGKALFVEPKTKL